MNYPPAEIHVQAATVRRLIDSECPSLAEEAIWLVDEGWDNVTYRVGTRYAARLPRREAAVALLLNEQRWLPLLAPRIRLETPVAVHVGNASQLFPWPWTVVHWIHGDTAENHCFTQADVAVSSKLSLLSINRLRRKHPSIRSAAGRCAPRTIFSASGSIVSETATASIGGE